MPDFGAQVILLTIFGSVTAVMAIESMRPLRAVDGMPVRRWLNNLALTVVDYAVLLGVSPWLGWLAARVVGEGHQGVLAGLGVGPWGALLALLVCLQFVNYWLHRALHRIPVLWRLHAVHHCDTEVDATTAHRHHPLEVLLSALAALPVVVWLDPQPIAVLGYNVLHAVVATISHGNLSLGWLDGLLRPFLVTPGFHRLHHAVEQRYTDSNYATVLPVFDQLFGTATRRPLAEQKTMQLGLARFREPRFARVDQMLLIPFPRRFWPR